MSESTDLKKLQLIQTWVGLKARKALVETIVDFDSASGFICQAKDVQRFVPFEDCGLTGKAASELVKRIWLDAIDDQKEAIERELIHKHFATTSDFEQAWSAYEARRELDKLFAADGGGGAS